MTTEEEIEFERKLKICKEYLIDLQKDILELEQDIKKADNTQISRLRMNQNKFKEFKKDIKKQIKFYEDVLKRIK